MSKRPFHQLAATSALALLSLVGCGGGSESGETPTKTGYFIDSAVEGLEYTSGSTSGTTGADGAFKYEEGKPVTFKIGNLVLGSVAVTNNRVFPVDLVKGASDETHANVTLIAQVLQSIDSDLDPSNGITISPSARQALRQAIDISNGDADQLTNSVLSMLQTTTGHALVPAAQARDHLRPNLVKEYAGSWKGSFSGGDSGSCTATVSDAGQISGTCTSPLVQSGSFTLSGTISSSGEWTTGIASTSANFNGKYTRSGTASGQWTNSNANLSGTWTMTK